MAVSASTYALKRAEKELSQSRVVLRHLPPNHTKEGLLDILDPFILSHTSFYFVPGRPSDQTSYSRAYLNIPNIDDIIRLRDYFDGLQLESSEKGVKYRMLVEYAPYQCSGSHRAKPDIRCGTLDKDPDYLSFLEQYEKETVHLPSIDLSYLDQVKHHSQVKSTPLVEYIIERRMSRRSGTRNKVTYASGKKKREKVKVIEVKERASSKSSQRKEKNSYIKKTSSATSLLSNGDATVGGGGASQNVESKERPDQTFYSPRGSRSFNDKSGSDRSGSDRGGSDRGGSDRGGSDRGGSDRGGSRGSRSGGDRGRSGGSDRGGGRGGRGGSDRGGDDRSGGRRWYKGEDTSRPQGNKYTSYQNDNYYPFKDDDDDHTRCPDRRGERDEHTSRYYGNRRGGHQNKKSHSSIK